MLQGLEHVHRFPLPSRNINISKGTPYNSIYGYQTIILTPLISLYELKNTKPMPSLCAIFSFCLQGERQKIYIIMENTLSGYFCEPIWFQMMISFNHLLLTINRYFMLIKIFLIFAMSSLSYV